MHNAHHCQESSLAGATLTKCAALGIWFCLAISAQAQSGQVPNDLILEGLRGKIKSVDEETAVIVTKKGVSVEAHRQRTRTLILDDRGRITYEWVKISDLPPFEHHYDYDKVGDQHRRTSRELSLDQQNAKGGDASQLSLKKYRFDPDKKTLFVDEYRGDEVDAKNLRQKYEYNFDDSGRITEHVTRDFKNREIFRQAYTYDAQGIISEARLSMAENPVGQVFVYKNTVDVQGNWVKRLSQMTILKSGVTQTEVIYRKISYRK